MKAFPAGTLLGVAAMLFAVWWVWSVLVQPVSSAFTGEKTPGEYLFLFTMWPVLSLPGIVSGYFGFRLLREKTPRNFKGAMVGFAVFAVFWLSDQLQRLFPVQVHEKLENSLFTFLASIVIILLYATLVAWFMRKEGLKLNGVRSLIGKGIVLVVALQIWQLGSRLFDVYAPRKPGHTYIYDEPWELLGAIVPVVSAYLFYRLVMWRINARSHAVS